jgi:hypothetical protein
MEGDYVELAKRYLSTRNPKLSSIQIGDTVYRKGIYSYSTTHGMNIQLPSAFTVLIIEPCSVLLCGKRDVCPTALTYLAGVNGNFDARVTLCRESLYDDHGCEYRQGNFGAEPRKRR